MQLTVTKYLCPFCGKWHSVGDPEFTAHFPTDEEQAIMMGKKAGEFHGAS